MFHCLFCSSGFGLVREDWSLSPAHRGRARISQSANQPISQRNDQGEALLGTSLKRHSEALVNVKTGL